MGVSWPLLAYALCNVVACGTLGVQGVLALRGHGMRLQLPAAVTALVCALASGVFSALRLGRLDRFVNVFGNPSSAVAQGYYAVALLLLVAVVLLVALRRSDEGTLPAWCALLAVAAGLLGVYALAANLTATVHSTAKTWLTVAYLLVAAAVLGTLVCTAIGSAAEKPLASKGFGDVLNAAGAAVLGVLTVVYGFAAPTLGARRATSLTTSTYGIVPGHPSGSSVSDVAALPGTDSALFWVGTVVVGAVVPLVLAVAMRKLRGPARCAAAVAGVACVLVGVGVTVALFGATTTTTKMFL